MKHLLVDAGNTFCKIALYDDCVDKLSTLKNFSYEKIEEQIFSAYQAISISSLLISNVNNKSFDICISELSKKIWKIEPIFLKSHNCNTQLQSQYENIRGLGCDRWAAMLAVFYENEKNFCIIDCGTAITIDLVIDSCHLGGLIAPGIYTSFKSLNQNTANLPKLTQGKLIRSVNIIGNNTHECIYAGVLNQALALIEKIISEFKNKYQNNLTVYITGGDSNLINTHTNVDMTVKENLVIDGLKMAAKYQLVIS